MADLQEAMAQVWYEEYQKEKKEKEEQEKLKEFDKKLENGEIEANVSLSSIPNKVTDFLSKILKII